MVLLPIGTVLDGDTDLIVGMNMPSGRSRRRALDLDLSDVNTELVLRSEIAAVGPAKHWAGDAKYEGGLIRVAGTASHPEIYIPCAVLFQFFWGVTSTLTNAVLSGELEAPERFIYNPHETSLLSDPVRVQIRNKWTDDEARYLVTLLRDSHALERGRRIFRRIAAAGIAGGLQGLPPVQLEVWPPFARQMQIEGILHEVTGSLHGATPYLVLTHIMSATIEPNWTSLVLLRETGRQGPATGAVSTPAPAPAPPPNPQGGAGANPTQGGPLEMRETPGGYSGTVELQLLRSLDERFPGLAKLDVQRPVTDEPREPRMRRRSRVLRGPWSAIPGTPLRDGKTRHAKLVGAAEPLEEPDQVQATQGAHDEPVDDRLLEFRRLFLEPIEELTIEGIKCASRILFCDPFEELWMRQSPSFFRLPERLADGRFTWLYRDPACLQTKLGLCVRVQVMDPSGQSRVRYLIELESRMPQHRAPTAVRKPRRSGLLVVWFDKELDPATACLRIRQVLTRAAVAGTPAIKYRPAPGVNAATLRHGAALVERAFTIADQCEPTLHATPATA